MLGNVGEWGMLDKVGEWRMLVKVGEWEMLDIVGEWGLIDKVAEWGMLDEVGKWKCWTRLQRSTNDNQLLSSKRCCMHVVLSMKSECHNILD